MESITKSGCRGEVQHVVDLVIMSQLPKTREPVLTPTLICIGTRSSLPLSPPRRSKTAESSPVPRHPMPNPLHPHLCTTILANMHGRPAKRFFTQPVLCISAVFSNGLGATCQFPRAGQRLKLASRQVRISASATRGRESWDKFPRLGLPSWLFG